MSTPNPFDRLVAEYEQWMRAQPASLTSLHDTSAEALLHEDITDAQRRFLSDFIQRWEAANDSSIDRWNDGAVDGVRGRKATSQDRDYLEGYQHGREQAKARVVMPERPEGYYHQPIEVQP